MWKTGCLRKVFRGNNKTSAKKSRLLLLKQDKPQCDKECSKLLDQRKQAKLQWLENPRQIEII